jgi:uncharacterized protein involved in response to NO
VWVALWLQPVGLVASALLPEMRVAALHVTFIGGFGLLALAVGAHVVLSHAGLEHLRERTPWPVPIWAGAIALALLARLVADWSDTYFAHLASASAAWILGSLVWLGFVARGLGRGGDADPGRGASP